MTMSNGTESEFLRQLIAIVEKNIANEQFGVSELAAEMNMSRSNLLRKVKKETKLSVSQLISQVRLKRAMELLRNSSLNVSEVSHQVGFNSTSYFIKCFREYYGYPPGEAGRRSDMDTSAEPVVADNIPISDESAGKAKSKFWTWLPVAAVGVLSAAVLFYFFIIQPSELRNEGKSIAVLPFKNDSNDSTNVYLINGLMEATLNNLQKIKGLKVTSRTSVEKYRNTSMSIPEMARELNVKYFVEGSGQKIGDKILLNIQLIEANTDKHLWANQYRREVKDIFELQEEIARNIAQEVQVYITPDEEKQIGKTPTSNPVAYDYFLKGRDLFYKSTTESLEASIHWFKKAIEQDNKFALAYANAAMVYYYLDVYYTNKKYSVELSTCADNAMSFDPALTESLIARALSFAHKGDYKQAIPHLEKAFEKDHNSGLVVHFLTEFYSIYVPNTAKYLEYALHGVRIDMASHDSVTTGFKYFHLANALIQSGFTEDAIRYIDKSLEYDPKSVFARYVRVWMIFARDKDLKQTKNLLITELSRDTNRLDVTQEVAKACYFLRDYKEAYRYYKSLIDARERFGLNIYKNENLNIAIVLSKLGMADESKEYVESFKDFADNDETIYKHLHLAAYHSWKGSVSDAIVHLKLFAKEDNFQYWLLLWELDPVFDNVRENPEFKKVMHDIETRFWDTHRKIRKGLDKKGLLSELRE